ncbi:MAG: glycosyltransferase family 4 protein [Rhodospirillales bacterium]|nr:glycosyltransferase family 4 protein [Rhodospirillales bacterium]
MWSRLYFAWAGDGAKHLEISRRLSEIQAADHVNLLGHVWNLPELMDAADLFVLPSYHEGMSRAIVEAMAKGLPVIATRVGGIPEALGGGEILLSAPMNVDRTASELARAIQNWPKMIKRGSKRVKRSAAGRKANLANPN